MSETSNVQKLHLSEDSDPIYASLHEITSSETVENAIYIRMFSSGDTGHNIDAKQTNIKELTKESLHSKLNNNASQPDINPPGETKNIGVVEKDKFKHVPSTTVPSENTHCYHTLTALIANVDVKAKQRSTTSLQEDAYGVDRDAKANVSKYDSSSSDVSDHMYETTDYEEIDRYSNLLLKHRFSLPDDKSNELYNPQTTNKLSKNEDKRAPLSKQKPKSLDIPTRSDESPLYSVPNYPPRRHEKPIYVKKGCPHPVFSPNIPVNAAGYVNADTKGEESETVSPAYKFKHAGRGRAMKSDHKKK
ncbi:uncharacterized protein LOC133351651 [Lethenteron reissneri]|uniref:uncharacterized protein LOC133351651 n=1 Tax=Lethenteron reissneri TaxID=7753 RepID=UPI002AB61CE7|nr:uncharacterized protein LOC133351651 [Lethenteron reissneri]XP_061422998.1 uncharacterized protein LOC133351651 [Lethenteron reissneri]XP_061423000.1 uncharacterized protein LOC133351651 [Lethenteron reissneri]XP_061423001.1 uncharacterized protein LOC133351651 [Lethenteron reissneri]XP_061423002.1 uncharacterized protein LOC133351651 [Lethenteron reissneri]XP_061423003.1 uncharacterized protein LOC133351651 [Lethenteron reissneri]